MPSDLSITLYIVLLFVPFLQISIDKDTAGDAQTPRKRARYVDLGKNLRKVVEDYGNRSTEEFLKGIVCNIEFK
jgi:hypothetical protein